MRLLIGIAGRKYSGKDTVGDMILEELYEDDLHTVKKSFADPLKEACRSVFGFDDEQLYGSKKEVVDEYWDITPRAAFQYVGTEMFRKMTGNLIPDVGEDIWVKSMERYIKENSDKNIIIPDVRFQNELDMINDNGGFIFKIVRPSLESTDTHASEINCDTLVGVDGIIINDGTVDELAKKVHRKLSNLRTIV